MEKFYQGIGKFLAVIVLMVASSAVQGYVLYKLWSWFIVPVFPNAPHLGIVQALGIALLIGYLTGRYSNSKLSEEDKKKPLMPLYAEAFKQGVIYALFILSVGWVYTLVL